MNVDNLLLDEMIKQFQRFPSIERVVLFGSRARGDNSSRSDYDLAVYGKVENHDKSRLRCVFNEELNTLHKIDVVFMYNLKDKNLIKNIEKEGVEIYVAAGK